MSAPLIETIFQQGSDQIQSQYELTFSRIPQIGGDFDGTPSLFLRLDKEFEIPRAVHYTYDTYYNGLRSPTVSYKDETEKLFKLDFRLDQNWQVYDILNKWKNLTFNPLTGIPGDKITTRTNITFKALGGDPTSQTRSPAKIIEFKFCGIKSLGVTPFNHESGDPARVDCELIYLYHTGDAVL
jgi:hypothetical protein